MKRLISIALMIILLTGAQLSAQDTLIVAHEDIQPRINEFLDDSKAGGYWDARTHILETSDSGFVQLVFEKGEPLSLGHFHFEGVEMKESNFLKKEILKNNSYILSIDLNKTNRTLSNLGYRLRSAPIVSKDAGDEYHVSYLIMEKPSLGIDALAAFNQAADSDTISFYGHLDLNAPNISGNGNSIHLYWKRLNPASETFDISYRHPWVFSTPLAVSAGFSREVVDGNYQILTRELGVEWIVNWNRSLLINFQDHRSIITYEGGLEYPDWEATHRKSIGLGYRQKGLDRSIHRGISLRTTLYQELNFEASSISLLNFRSEFEFPLRSKAFLNQKSAVQIQTNVDELRDPSRLLPLGGVNSVRGYAENIYRSRSIASLQNELIMKLGTQSQLFALMDMGVYLDGDDINEMLGYGVGVQLRSGQGPIRIVFATHSGLDLQNSFLHIQYSRNEAWIDR